MIENISQIVDPEAYHTKTFPDNTVKIDTYQPETYRNLIRHLKEEEIIHHSYQLKEERAHRVVIRNLHHSTSTTDIISELGSKGHKVRNVINVRHRQTKDPLQLFFVDLEPQDNNKDIYNIEFIENTKIRVEPPRHKRDIVQCLRCQSYEHTRRYCMRTFNCVKCAGPHDTKDCSKPKDTPATCVLCKGAHPANFKGCNIYRELLKLKYKHTYKSNPNTPNANRHSHLKRTIINKPQSVIVKRWPTPSHRKKAITQTLVI
jgi:PAX-interacting protein 1